MVKEAKKGMVVIIDDEEKITKLVAQTLEMRGYQTIQYTDGQSAIEGFRSALKNGNVDISVILSDIRIPHKNGPDTVEEILGLYKNCQEANKPEIRFMSSKCYEYENERAMEISNNPILDKPFLIKPLVEAINSANNDFYKRIDNTPNYNPSTHACK